MKKIGQAFCPNIFASEPFGNYCIILSILALMEMLKGQRIEKLFYKGYGVVYLPGDINGLAKKLHLLAAEFFAGNTSVRNELVHVLDALLRLKQLTRKEYADMTAHLAASL